MEQKYKNFKKYNWAYSNEWTTYYNNLFPSPPITKLLHYKKKFYKNYIDPDFDIDYIPPEGEKLETEYKPPQEVIDKNLRKNKNQSNNNNVSGEGQKSDYEKIVEKYEISKKNYKPINSNIFKYSQLLFSFIFIISIPFGIKTYQFVLDAFLIKLFREIGKPSFSKLYLQYLLLNDTFHTLIYIFICSIDNYNYYMLLPLVLSIIIASAEDLKNINIFKNVIHKVTTNEKELIQNKTHIEILIGFLQIIGVLFGINTFKIPIIYWNFLRFRYLVNPYVYKSFEELNQKVNKIKENDRIPKFIINMINKIQIIFKYFGNNKF